MDSGPTSDVDEQAERVASLSGVTKDSGNSQLADVVTSEVRAATKREAAQTAADRDEQATKKRLETLLQLETHARLTIEENFRRVKGFSFVFLVSISL